MHKCSCATVISEARGLWAKQNPVHHERNQAAKVQIASIAMAATAGRHRSADQVLARRNDQLCASMQMFVLSCG
jgi:hypothetical protein